MSIRGEENPRYCTCTKTTPVQFRTSRYRCPAHKYLRSGESIYMSPGRLVFGGEREPLRRGSTLWAC